MKEHILLNWHGRVLRSRRRGESLRRDFYLLFFFFFFFKLLYLLFKDK